MDPFHGSYESMEHLVLGDSHKITKTEQAVIDAAKNWDVLYKARAETTPEDDELHFAVTVLLAVENQ
jgi:hypothetical protein